MLLDAKLVEDRELEQSEVDQRDLLAEEELPQIAGDEVVAEQHTIARDPDREHRGMLVSAVRALLEERPLDVEQLPLSPREITALIALQTAVSGRDHQLDHFVYADDRRDMLEQALAVLQPNLVHGDVAELADMRWVLGELAATIGELRQKLSGLGDAQDELLVEARALDKAEGSDAPDTVDTPAAAAAKAAKAEAAAKAASLFDGPEFVPGKAPPTTLAGPELPAAKPVPTTLVGPDLPATKAAPSTLVGPDLPADKPVPTTLLGPELPPTPTPTSTLGEPPEPDAPAPTPKPTKAKRG